ncbi:hypothetical protein FGO68_gene11238 [Halteria grandinella]|uniref:Uncharacterized protein n=1 Tax=Halteria grandinella TaxID=5974 RepID=A0A8J8SZS5_HALGN|nr:hypothetical protein FGO68_gene11238 [Halteria grandinella]
MLILYIIISNRKKMNKAKQQVTLANVLADENVPLCSCGQDKAIFFCSKSCGGQSISCIQCWTLKHKKCENTLLREEVRKYANKWLALSEKISTLYAQFRGKINTWGFDFIKFAEQIIEPNNLGNEIYKKRIITNARAKIENELMANLRLEYMGEIKQIYFNTINTPNQQTSNQEKNVIYCQRPSQPSVIGLPTKQQVEDYIRNYDIGQLIQRDDAFNWYEKSYETHLQAINGLSSIMAIYPEISAFNFTSADLIILTDQSLNHFLEYRTKYIEALQAAQNPANSNKLIQLLILIRKIDQEIHSRYIRKQSEIIAKQQKEIDSLQALIGGASKKK